MKAAFSKLKEFVTDEKFKKEMVQDFQLLFIAAIGMGLLILFVSVTDNGEPKAKKTTAPTRWEAK